MSARQDAKPADYYENIRAEMLPFVPREAATVLDIGCGMGYFGAALKRERDRVVWGIEVVPESGQDANRRLDHVIVGDVAMVLAQVPEGFFDVVVFNDVLEHLVDPGQVLASVRSKLKAGGVVVSSIPNIRYYPIIHGLVIHKRWEYEESGILDSTHLRFFTITSIRNMYERLGYEVIRNEGINLIPDMPWTFRLVNFLSRGRFCDMRYLQFATVARPSSNR